MSVMGGDMRENLSGEWKVWSELILSFVDDMASPGQKTVWGMIASINAQ